MSAWTAAAPPDEELLHRALDDAQGNDGRHAASMLLERYQDRVYIWCVRLVRNHELALDLAQEVLLNAYRRLDTFEGRAGFSSWLFVIARNRCLSALRKSSALRETDSMISLLADPSAGPDRLFEERLDEEELLNLIRSHLDAKEQEAVWLRCIEGLPVDEITRMLDLGTASGARGLLQRARRKLRSAMAGNHPGGTDGQDDQDGGR